MIQPQTFFAPELHIPKKTTDIEFYKKFGATENFCLRNNDGSIHVAELKIFGAIFHLHETIHINALDPVTAEGVTGIIGLFVEDVEKVMQQALSAGAKQIDPTTDHEYGYRQGSFEDPFGHIWQIQKKINHEHDVLDIK